VQEENLRLKVRGELASATLTPGLLSVPGAPGVKSVVDERAAEDRLSRIE